MSTTPKPPFISKEDIDRIHAALPAKLAEMERDDEDRRCLRGKHAPEHGRCRVCPGHVIAHVTFHRSDRLGGPPPQAYVARWHCDSCGLVYEFCPPPEGAMTGGWMSKGPGERKPGGSTMVVRPGTQCTQTAHFIVDGAPVCAQAVFLDGRPRFAPFLCSWVELRGFDRRCKVCSEMLASPTAHRRQL